MRISASVRPVPSPERLLGPSPDFIDRLIARDESAYEELVRSHGPRMLAVATRYLPRPADAEDVLQNAFMDVVRFISKFRRASSLDTWLHRVVANRALMRLRSRRRRPETLLEDAALENAGASPRSRRSPESAHDVVALDETRSLVRFAVNRLPEKHRSVLLLRDVESIPLRDIATLLDVGLSTVKTRLHRGRLALQRALAPRLAPSGA